jgi:hypothetical protein
MYMSVMQIANCCHLTIILVVEDHLIRKRNPDMLYELRLYEATPGKLAALNARFENHTLKFFAKHGIKVIGFWTTSLSTTWRSARSAGRRLPLIQTG